MAEPGPCNLCSPLHYKCSFCSFQDYIWELICLGLIHLRTVPCYRHQLCLSLPCPRSGPSPTLWIREIFAHLEKLLVQPNFI